MTTTVETGTARGPQRGRIGFVRKAKAYVALTKPRVIELLLVTTAPVMVLAANGIPNLWLVLATLVGGALSAGSANAFNCYLDRDIDRIMNRTKKRPLVTGELTDREALVFAWVTGRGFDPVARAARPTGSRPRSRSAPSCSTSSSTRCGSSAARRRTSSGAASRAACPCSSAGRPSPARSSWRAVHPVRHRVPLDAAALLAAVDEVPRRLRVGERADARRRARTHRGRPAGRALRVGDGRVLTAAHPDRRHGTAVHRRRAAERRLVHRRVAPAVLDGDPRRAR